MSKRIRANHEWFELRGAHVRVSRTTRDCDMAEHTEGWRDAIKPGHRYAWMSHGLNVCALHFSPEDITNGRNGDADLSEEQDADGGAGAV